MPWFRFRRPADLEHLKFIFFFSDATEYCVVNVPILNRFSYHADSSSCVLDLRE